ncbi:hypothetical protein C8Q80DRAFT_1164819 [Daedaleopsis nitida]|nr:hypothetical protein C8Q80DRAFT_1164819 [Daedaleopsis nitida]
MRTVLWVFVPWITTPLPNLHMTRALNLTKRRQYMCSRDFLTTGRDDEGVDEANPRHHYSIVCGLAIVFHCQLALARMEYRQSAVNRSLVEECDQVAPKRHSDMHRCTS